MKPKEVYKCHACGDYWYEKLLHKEKCYCKECHDELEHGKIRTWSVHFCGGDRGSGGRGLGDPSPWLENAVRHLEDG